LFLDTWPYNAHTTASDALWAGCPVISLLGDTFAGRVAASLLNAVGLPELVMPDVERYILHAINLGHDRYKLQRLRAYLDGAGRASPLFDTTGTTRAIERAYETLAAQTRVGVRSQFRVDE
jgi:predicted O-linked N-acetylglucosamine transferase (SPINDLY family)